jgi:hypothetical protein
VPILEIVAIVAALAALLVAWRAQSQLKTMQAKLDRLQSTLYETRQEQRDAQSKAEQKLAALDVRVQKATGQMRFDPNLSLVRLYERSRAARPSRPRRDAYWRVCELCSR